LEITKLATENKQH